MMEEIRWVDQNGWLINRVSISDAGVPAVALHRAIYKILFSTHFLPHQFISDTSLSIRDNKATR